MSGEEHDFSVIDVHGRTLPEVWEKAVIMCWHNGREFTTEYDKKDDPPSRDCVARMVVTDPMAEPRIHKAIPAGLEDLEIYRQEVLYGVHDNWVDPAAGKWEYTYHERLFDYSVPGGQRVNQIERVIEKLVATPHTRRAQAVTWQCWMDLDCVDPACLQRLWFRIQGDKLNMNISMRSNDAFKAAFMNMYAFTELQAWVARRVSEKIGREIGVGRYIHMADSFHIYGSYFEEFENFIRKCYRGRLEDRVFDSSQVEHFMVGGKITLFNNTQTDIPMPVEHLRRLYAEIPEDRRSELDPAQVERMRAAG
jgi:thymidylate synthase